MAAILQEVGWPGRSPSRSADQQQAADRSYTDEGVRLLELARNAERLFAKQEPREKCRLLNFLLSNCTWEDGEVVATFRRNDEPRRAGFVEMGVLATRPRG